jgi:hypothetical protein
MKAVVTPKRPKSSLRVVSEAGGNPSRPRGSETQRHACTSCQDAAQAGTDGAAGRRASVLRCRTGNRPGGRARPRPSRQPRGGGTCQYPDSARARGGDGARPSRGGLRSDPARRGPSVPDLRRDAGAMGGRRLLCDFRDPHGGARGARPPPAVPGAPDLTDLPDLPRGRGLVRRAVRSPRPELGRSHSALPIARARGAAQLSAQCRVDPRLRDELLCRPVPAGECRACPPDRAGGRPLAGPARGGLPAAAGGLARSGPAAGLHAAGGGGLPALRRRPASAPADRLRSDDTGGRVARSTAVRRLPHRRARWGALAGRDRGGAARGSRGLGPSGPGRGRRSPSGMRATCSTSSTFRCWC